MSGDRGLVRRAYRLRDQAFSAPLYWEEAEAELAGPEEASSGPVVAQVLVVKTIDGEIDTCTISRTALAHAYTMQTKIFRTRLLKSQKNCADSTAWATILKSRDKLESAIKSRFARTVRTLSSAHATATSTKVLPVSQRRIRNSLLPSCGRLLSFTCSEGYARDIRQAASGRYAYK